MRRPVNSSAGKYTLLLAAFLLYPSGYLQAQVNFNNGPASVGVVPMSILSDDYYPIHVADDFVLPSSAPTISKIQWQGYFGGVLKGDPIPPSEFNIEIYAIFPGASVPSLPIHAWYNINPRVQNAGFLGSPKYNFSIFPIFKFTYEVPRISLDPGRTYWIAIYGSDSGSPGDFAWAHNGKPGNLLFRVPTYSPTFFSVPVLLPVHTDDVSFKLYQ